jgi:hypothetical protein
MNDSIEILDPKVEIKVRGETIVVREMPWPKSIEFIRKLGLHAQQLVDAEGKLSLNLGKIVGLIANTAELAEFLVRESTGKPDEWRDSLPMSQMLAVLDAAISINLSSDAVGNAKKLEGRLRSLFAAVPAGSITASQQS